MTISPEHIITSAINALHARASDLDLEQAVRGIDSLNETQIHEIIAQGLLSAGLGVFREAYYPSDGDAYTGSTRRQRCDIALTNTPDIKLIDPIDELKQEAQAADTLFAGMVQAAHDTHTTATPENAHWIEIKATSLYAYRDGIPGPNPSYGNDITNGLQTDLCKISSDPLIWHGSSMLILFTDSEDSARRDLQNASQVCLDNDIPVRTPLIECAPITDRAGNACVGIGLYQLSI
ncbi:MAG: hypothetical protein AB8C13_00775 [Phycisphaerales bacterium]